jgi:hypothetical protein
MSFIDWLMSGSVTKSDVDGNAIPNANPPTTLLPSIVEGLIYSVDNSGLNKYFMNMKTGRVFAAAFLGVIVLSVCMMLWTPQVYSSTARIKPSPAPYVPSV